VSVLVDVLAELGGGTYEPLVNASWPDSIMESAASSPYCRVVCACSAASPKGGQAVVSRVGGTRAGPGTQRKGWGQVGGGWVPLS